MRYSNYYISGTTTRTRFVKKIQDDFSVNQFLDQLLDGYTCLREASRPIGALTSCYT
jgi:hypothetical protein